MTNHDTNTQQRLLRVRPPRVRITYEVETGGAMEKRELPFVVGVFADLSGGRDDAADNATPLPFKTRKMREIDRDNFDAVLGESQARVSLAKVTDVFAVDGERLKTSICFATLADFEPARLIENVPVLAEAVGRSRSLRAATRHAEADGVDTLINKQLSLILHDPAFQKLEASWRGLFHLVSHADTSSTLKLRVFDATLKELHDDLCKAVEFDQSHLFKLVYEAEYGTFGGVPYSLLVGAYEIGRSEDDMDFLRRMSQIAAATHAPFITSASPALFGLDDFADLSKPRALAKIFESSELAAWRDFRDSEDSRYVALTLPRVLMRVPYGQDGLSRPEDETPGLGAVFPFKEELALDVTGAPDKCNFLWGNAGFLLAERITNAFALFNWPAAIRGAEGGGLVEGLPVVTAGAAGDVEQVCPTELAISDHRERELSELGFIALCHRKCTGSAAFFGSASCAQPKRYADDRMTTDAIISSRLPAMLTASRFAHYVKVIMREKVGCFLTRANVESYLNSWIANYVLLDDNAPEQAKASLPLRAAVISVTEQPGSPGSYLATLFVKPHYQLEELSGSIRLVVSLPG